MPAEHAIGLPESTPFVLYTDGVIERDRKPLSGQAQLYDAVRHGYQCSTPPTAGDIERQMLLMGSNHYDVAILTAWTPLAPVVRNPFARRRLRTRYHDAFAAAPCTARSNP